MKKYILFGLGLLTGVLSNSYKAKAQDIHFSQFYETSILRNPSLVGIFPKDYKFSFLYRNQWSSISKPYQTGLVTGEMRFPISYNSNDFVSAGLLGYFDKAGSVDLQTVTIYPAINYNKCLNEEHSTFLSAGFTGGFVQRSYDPGKATFDNQYQNDRFDPGNPTGENLGTPQFNYWDLGAGVTYTSSTGQNNSTNYSFGVAGYHFTRPKNSFNNNAITLAVKWNVNADLTKILNEIWSFQVHANYMKQGTYNETNIGGLLGWNKKEDGGYKILFGLYGGVFYRVNDAFIPTLKLRWQDFNFAFSYDANVSKLKAASNLKGGYELCITKIGWISSPDAEKSRTICPE